MTDLGSSTQKRARSRAVILRTMLVGGFGLGLSICRKVVQIHGGSLKITSQPKMGTTVFIDLPDRQLRSPASFLEPVT